MLGFKNIMVFAQEPKQWADFGLGCVEGGVATLKGFECLFINILRVVSVLAGLAFGAMFIVGGFKLITAGGEPKGMKEAQATMTSALLGLVLVVLAWFALRLIEEITGLKVTEFKVGP